MSVLTKPRPKAYRIAHLTADLHNPAIRSAFRRAVLIARRFLPRDLAFWLARRDHDIMDRIPWRDMQLFMFRPVRDALIATLFASARTTLTQEVVKAATLGSLGLSLNQTNPRALRWAQDRAAELIVDVSEETRQSVRVIIERMFREGIPPDDAAKLIRDVVGLTEKQARAVERYYNRLGPRDDRDGLVEDFADRLLQSRAETIARTESMMASNRGQQELWQQAQENGFLEADRTRRAWLITDDPRLCPLCEPLRGALVGLDEDFSTDIGMLRTPPLHPRCRCTVALVFADEGGEFHHPQV